ncbi:hypothetical protein CC86DRAFT_67343 [Ophiobolus disseminans]|uniref:Xylanolytic transcriptional activator regulatory domain-containing protein n=1 Tax=Ophiobolus disseminans TaxID=1469910 RepID=A0A6A6ZSI4_9PLEO|nr:hypothetical protein CC86DRAFT_67343 [Ophiobolus disseminans]
MRGFSANHSSPVDYAALQGGEPYIPSHTWHTQLQIVLAIGAHYSLLTSGSKQEDGCAHSIYHSRAWALSLKSCWWALKPDLPQMQVAGLLSFYYLSIGSINRSWTFIGIALRIGYALGLHTHNDVASSAVTKEVLSRIWWGHFSLDTMLAAMTGRPSVQLYTTYPVPLPLPVSSTEIEETIIESRFGNRKTNPEGLYARTPPSSFTETVRSSAQTMSNYSAYELEPTNSGSYLKHVVQLGKITNDTLKLYTEKTDESWQGIQETIVRLVEELDLWATSLPEGLDFDKREADTGQKYEREKHALEILFHGTKILITRPCLCRLDRHTMTQSARLSEFNESMALTCLESAKMVARLLPNRPEVDVVLLYETTSWWNIVHVIMQSLVVLLLEMSCEANYSPHDGHEMLPSMKKLVRWLRALRANNAMAQRAYPHIMDFLRASVCKIKTVSGHNGREHHGACLLDGLKVHWMAAYFRN